MLDTTPPTQDEDDRHQLQAEHALAIAESLDNAGFSNHETLALLGILVRLFIARVPDTIRDADIADWTETFLQTPCPFRGHLKAHDDA